VLISLRSLSMWLRVKKNMGKGLKEASHPRKMYLILKNILIIMLFNVNISKLMVNKRLFYVRVL